MASTARLSVLSFSLLNKCVHINCKLNGALVLRFHSWLWCMVFQLLAGWRTWVSQQEERVASPALSSRDVFIYFFHAIYCCKDYLLSGKQVAVLGVFGFHTTLCHSNMALYAEAQSSFVPKRCANSRNVTSSSLVILFLIYCDTKALDLHPTSTIACSSYYSSPSERGFGLLFVAVFWMQYPWCSCRFILMLGNIWFACVVLKINLVSFHSWPLHLLDRFSMWLVLSFSPLNSSVFSSESVICYYVHFLARSDQLLGNVKHLCLVKIRRPWNSWCLGC